MRVHKGVALVLGRLVVARRAAAAPAATATRASQRLERRGGTRAPPATPKRGGTLTIARIEDSQSFDKTNVFQNESIWLPSRSTRPSTPSAQDGKTLKPWLATSYTKSSDGLTYTFKLRHGREVLQRPAHDVGRRQVLDRRRPRAEEGLGLPRRGDQEASPRPTRRPSSSTSSTAGRRSSPTSRCSRTGSSRRTSPARRAPTSTSTRSAPARSCGTRASSASR